MPVCANCGYTGAPEASPKDAGPREPQSTFAGARAKLATATQDLFRLSGGHSIPVEPDTISVPPAAPLPADDSAAGRAREASIIFSLEELMKAGPLQTQPQTRSDEVSEQLWSMQSATPLFGTAHDQALLTTPLKPELTSMESMTVPSRRPQSVRRWMPLVGAIAGGSALLAGIGWWAFGPNESEARSSVDVPAVTAEATEKVRASTEPAEGLAPSGQPSADVPPGAQIVPSAEAAVPDVAVAVAVADPAATSASDPAAAEAAPQAEPDEAAEGAEATQAPASGSKSRRTAASKRKAAAKVTPPASAAKAGFNKDAAKNALASAAAKASGCKAGGAGGKGKVQLTFATTGRVSSAQLVEGPFGGTAAGKCALRHFKAARVPAFSGAPQTVAKSFKIP